MAHQRPLDEFAKQFVLHVRDEAIRACDELRSPESDKARAKRWRELKEQGRIDELLSEMVPDCVDVTIICFLRALEKGLLRLTFTTAAGDTIELKGVDLAKPYAAVGGWREIYSKQRYNPDIADLA